MPFISDPDGLSQGGITTPGDLSMTAASGSTGTLTGTASLPAVTAGDYIEVRGLTNAANNGLYLVTGTPTTSAIDVTKMSLSGAAATLVNEGPDADARIFGSNADEKNIYFDANNLLFTFLNGFGSVTVLDNAGVQGQALYSFMKEEWINDNDLRKIPFPMVSITPEQFEFTQWRPVDEAESTISTGNPSNTRQLLRFMGWDEVDANGFLIDAFFGWITLGNIDAGDNAYGYFSSADSAADIITAVFDGPVNEGVQTVQRIDLSGAGTLAFVDGGGGNDSFTRTTGSWITDGFKVGDYVFFQNAEDAANDGQFEVLSVTATTLEVATGSFTANADDTTVLVALDRRLLEFSANIRVFGKTYQTSTSTSIGVTNLINQPARFPLSEAADAVIVDLANSETGGNIATLLSNITGGVTAPYDDMTIAYFATGQSRSGFNDVGGDAGVTNFSVIIDADVSVIQEDGGGAASAEQVYAFVQAQLQSTLNINDGAGAAAVTVIGQLAEPLLSIASTGNTLSGLVLTDGTNPGGSAGEGIYVDSFSSLDKNRVQFTDDDGDLRTFPLTVAVTLNFNANLVTDAAAQFTMYFENDNAGDNLGRDYGTFEAIIVQDDTLANISGAIASSQLSYNYAYDGNVQRGAASASTPAPVVIVALGLSLAQYVVATGTITNTGLTASLVAALERNYSNP